MSGCNEYNSLSRRQMLKGAAAAGAALTMPAWMPRIAYGQGGSGRDTLIMLFLGGGIDGLTLCVPHGDSKLYQRRPNLAVPAPDTGVANRAIDLNGFYGLPPSLAPLRDIFVDDKLLFVHATGADKTYWSRSHFDAQVWMEAGKTNDISVSTGWLGRHLASIAPLSASAPLRAIGFDYGQMETLRGGPKTLPVPYPEYYGYDGWYPNRNEMINWLKGAYGATTDPLKSAATNAIATVDLLNEIDFGRYQPGGGAIYPQNSDIGRSLRATAAMLKHGIPLEAIGINFGGWDTHDNQGSVQGYMHDRLTELGQALYAFYTDMTAANKNNWVLVGMSEFGRNVIENGSRGTDHGTGNAMLLMGNVLGGRIVANWPGLRVDQLFEGQDLQVTIDYRDILAEIVKKRLKNDKIGTVFPGYNATFRGVVPA